MEPFRDDDLAAELSALRPQPRPAFAAELDERAAAGFPHRTAGGGSPLTALAAWLRAQRPRRLLIPAGAVALVALVAITAVVATTEPSSENSAGGGGGNLLGQFTPIDPSQESPALGADSAAGSAGAGGTSSSGIEYEAQPPVAKAETGPFAAQADHREVERSAQLVLATESGEVGAAAAEVFDAVHANDGIVLRSSTSGGGESAGASFELLIPSAKLSEALAAFSAIAEVRSRHEATADVTARTVGLDERLQDARATVAGLLKQLAAAESAIARDVAEAELRSARLRVASLRSRLAAIERRTNFSRVSLRIEGGGTSSGSGSWSAGDALGDAGHVLGIAAGVAIVGLAIIGPVALLALLAWLLNRARLRRGRERALG